MANTEKQNKKCYIVGVGEPWSYAGLDWTSTVFTDRKEAEDYFDKIREEKTQQTINDNGLSEEEAKEYREEIAENASYDYCEDPDGEWAVNLNEAYLFVK